MNKEKAETLLENYQALSELYNNMRKELECTCKALDKGMEHITGLNNMIESWYKLLQSDKDTSTKYAILIIIRLLLRTTFLKLAETHRIHLTKTQSVGAILTNC